MSLRQTFYFLTIVASALVLPRHVVGAEVLPSPGLAFVKQHCVNCHNQQDLEGDFRLDNIVSLSTNQKDVVRWEKVLEMVDLGEMPPKDLLVGQTQPSEAEREQFVSFLSGKLAELGRGRSEYEQQLPSFANRVDHDELFGGEHQGPAYTPARVWRMNSEIYSQLLRDMDLSNDFVPPLTKVDDKGFADYSILYADEATIRTLLSNAKRAALAMVEGRLIKPRGAGAKVSGARGKRNGSRHRVFLEFCNLESEPTRSEMERVVRFTFDLLLHREPSPDELARHVDKNLAVHLNTTGNVKGLQAFLVTILLSPEFLFRMEMGLGEQLPDGRRMLSPHELAFALSFAFHDHPVESLLDAAKERRLTTRADVEREVRRLVADPKLLRGRMAGGSRDRIWAASKPYDTPAKPKLLRFFQEYFDYAKAADVFKDDIRHGGSHDPKKIVRDANWLVLRILAEDQDVLKKLLTTDQYMVDYFFAKREETSNLGYATVYNLVDPNWPVKSAVAMPSGQRAGMLTHPAWLVAHSGNFETDPVRRGKWIRERLLGEVVPDLPINVEAQLPEEPHHTIRERFRVVHTAACWRCHKKMNPLGYPFEAYDDFGRYREKHHVTKQGDVLASVLEMGHRRRLKEGEAVPQVDVNTTGKLTGTGDPALDGPVEDAVEMMQRLAKSDRVRQVFLRHVFRYWLGRNETLADSPTLIEMDRVYVESGGSFQETLVALLTSDSFLYRK